MGWTNLHRDKGLTNAEFFQRELFPSGNSIILPGSTTIGGTFYAAVKTVGPEHGTVGEVWALVVLTQWTRDWFNFTYKEMSETMGPGDEQAPLSLLNKLTETDHEYALAWRSQCRANAERKARADSALKGIEEGDQVILANRLRFTDGTDHDTFEVRLRRDGAGRRRKVLTADGRAYRVPHWRRSVVAVVSNGRRIDVVAPASA